MRLPRFAIQNHQFTVIIIILLVLSGVVSFLTMPRSEDPQVAPPGSTIIIIYPGANPADMEELVVDPVEEVLNELEDIKDIQSNAEHGLAVIAIEFLSGSDPDEKFSDVVQQVSSILNDLPDEIISLKINKHSISDTKILQLALVSDTAPYHQLESEAERLERLLERIPGVKKIESLAYPERQIRISLDMERLAKFHIPLNRIISAVQSNNANIPGGNIDLGSRRYSIQTSGSFRTPEEIENTILDASGGQIVFLKDVAEVQYGYEDRKYYGRFQGNRAVFVTATQKEGTNIFSVMDGIHAQLAEFRTQLPSDIQLSTAFDSSESVAYRLNGFFSNLLQGLILVGLVVLLAVGLRASMIVMLAIPVSILIAIGFIDLNGYGLEQMSIAGLVISLGLLVDNAIVVTENISRFMRKDIEPLEAAIRGTEQISWAIVSATATTILAFVPIILMQDVTGDFIRSMPVTVIFTLAASLLMSLTLTPYLSSKFIKASSSTKQGWFARKLNHFIDTRYRKRLAFSLAHPKTILIATMAVFLLSLALFPLVGVSFFPKSDKGQFMVNIDTPNGTNLAETDSMAVKVEQILKTQPEIRRYVTNIGRGNPRIYYNAIPKHEQSTHVQIFVQLKKNDPDLLNQIVQRLRSGFSEIPGAKIKVKEFEQGPPVEAPIAIRIIGDNLETLQRISLDVEKMFASQPGIVNITNPLATSKTDIFVKINRAKAGILGIPVVEIDRTVRAAMAGLAISSFRDLTGKEFDIIVRLPNTENARISDFDKIYISSLGGGQVPLKQVASVEFGASPMEINHYNLERTVTITSDVERGASVNDLTRNLINKLSAYNWPKGYHFTVAGELEQRQESFGGMAQATILAIVGIFGVLVLQFRSYSQPLIVFAAIPLAIIGSILALLITGNSFSFTAFVGLTSLVGIVINNSIILVDYTNQLLREGKDITQALQTAGETRFTPIILTTATTIGGLLPLTLGGGSLWAPMGWTIIGGLLVSTFLTLIVVPVLFKLFTREHKIVVQ